MSALDEFLQTLRECFLRRGTINEYDFVYLRESGMFRLSLNAVRSRLENDPMNRHAMLTPTSSSSSFINGSQSVPAVE